MVRLARGLNRVPESRQAVVDRSSWNVPAMLASIACLRPLDRLTYFSDDEDAWEKFVVVSGAVPGCNVWIAAPTLSHLGNNVRVDQVHSKLTKRPVSRDRRISSPSVAQTSAMP